MHSLAQVAEYKRKRLAASQKKVPPPPPLDVWWNQRLARSTTAAGRKAAAAQAKRDPSTKEVTTEQFVGIARELGVSISKNEARRLVKMYANDPLADGLKAKALRDALDVSTAKWG